MRSIGSRLALWYALASTATLTLIVVIGYYLLATHLVSSIDQLNRQEFQLLRASLRPDFAVLEPEMMAERLRVATEVSSIPIFLEARLRGLGTLYASENLEGHPVVDVPGANEFDLKLVGVGELRVGRFTFGRMTVFIASSMEDMRRTMRGYLRVSAVLIAVTAAVSCGLGLWLSRVALRPVRLIQETADHISSTNLSERIPVGVVDDEMANLARLLNQMFDRLESAFKQVRLFTAEASHELKTPLALARAHAERLLDPEMSLPVRAEEVQNLLEELAHLERIIEELLLLSRAEASAVPLELRSGDPHEFVRQFAQDARILGEFREVHLDEHYAGEGRAEFDPKWMRQVLLNLVTNALRVSPRAGRVRLESVIADDVWGVAVEDEGPGVPPDQLERIFERFFRLAHNGDDKGAGLGLAISRSIVALHRGTIRAELPAKGRGLRVVCTLPASPANSPRVVVDGQSLARASDMPG